MVDAARTLKAVGFETSTSDPSHAKLLQVPLQALGPRDILVRVKAVSLNPVDYKKRKLGFFSPPGAPLVLGFDASGVVEELGAEVKFYKKGDEVYYAGDISRNGSNAEFQVVDERIVGKKPKSLDYVNSASFPLVALTAWEGLFEGLHISLKKEENKGKSILVLGGAGGVGSVVVQLAKHIAGLHVIASASREETKKFCLQLGADEIINHRNNIKEELTKLNRQGVDYVFNTSDMPKKVFDQISEVLNPLGGMLCITGFTEPVDLASLFVKRCFVAHEFMFARPVFGVEAEKQRDILDRVSELIDNKTLQNVTTVAKDFSVETLVEGHRAVESGTNIGKFSLDKVGDFFAKH